MKDQPLTKSEQEDRRNDMRRDFMASRSPSGHSRRSLWETETENILWSDATWSGEYAGQPSESKPNAKAKSSKNQKRRMEKMSTEPESQSE